MQSSLKLAIASVLGLSASSYVLAQEQQEQQKEQTSEEISEVVVTGYRASLQGALEVKRNSDLVVDAISGGDIGALPDVTIAETLVRLPGINGTRDRGNQSQAAVRGLGPRLVLGLVNGREVASSEPNRNVRWEIYPSEVVAGVDVYKAQSADIVAGGVAGTIDIKTVRPLEYSGPDLLLRGGAVYYEAGADFPDYDPFGYRGSGSFTKSVGDNFAFNLGVSLQRQKNAFPSFQGWGYNDNRIWPSNATADITGDSVADPVPWGAQTEVKKLTEDRTGVNGSIGWRAGDNFELNIDALYSKFTIDEDQNQAWYGRDFLGNWDGSRNGCYTGAGTTVTQADDGSVVAANLNNCYAPVTNVIANYTEDKDLFVAGANAKVTSGAWLTTIDLSTSKAKRTNRWAAFFTEIWPQNMFFDMSSGGEPVLITSGSNANPADPTTQTAPTWLPGNSDGPDNLEDRLFAMRADMKRTFEGDNLKELSFGLRSSARDKDFFRRQQRYNLTTNVTVPADYFSFFSVDGFTAPPLLDGDFDELADLVYGGAPVDMGAILQSSIWNVDESVLEAFAKVRFEGSLGSVPFNANAGVRLVQTKTTSKGFSSLNDGALQAIDISNDYTEALPSLNFNFNLAEDKILRVGLARVLARPPLDELRASRALYNEAQPFTGNGGNPDLEPFRANQADVSFEWYFAPEALAALAVFYKDVDSHIGYTTDAVVIDGATYLVTGPFNGDGGGITGAELTFQTPFPFFKNMGLYMNYAYVDTDVKEFYPPPNPLPIEGYAKNTATVDLWYNQGGFEARLGYKYHSPFTIIGGWDGSDVRTLGEERVLDFSSSYDINDSFGLRFQVNNLTDKPVRIWRDNDPNRLGSYNIYGRRALLDFTFKF